MSGLGDCTCLLSDLSTYSDCLQSSVLPSQGAFHTSSLVNPLFLQIPFCFPHPSKIQTLQGVLQSVSWFCPAYVPSIRSPIYCPQSSNLVMQSLGSFSGTPNPPSPLPCCSIGLDVLSSPSPPCFSPVIISSRKPSSYTPSWGMWNCNMLQYRKCFYRHNYSTLFKDYIR